MHISIYADEEQKIINELINTPEMQRLGDVGMHCGCEYTSLPAYRHERYRYSRLIHSIGVSRIVFSFTNSIIQAVAGLLHDIATPVFAHAIDFMNNDHEAQASTEHGTLRHILGSAHIMQVLSDRGIDPDVVSNYHIYPIADNDTPMLSADRLEYTLGNGYLLNGYELDQVKRMYDDLIVAENEHGAQELCFQSFDIARDFAEMALRNSRLYVSDEDRFAMQKLAEIIREAIKSGILDHGDLQTTESEVVSKLKSNRKSNEAWEAYRNIASVSTSPAALCDRYCVNVPSKKRYIDPLVATASGVKRISKIDAEIKGSIASFLDLDFNYWVYDNVR
ncbi:MAG: hypothetical protein FWH33_00795 [Oscillospiraceae bacterium]|nr:hypothetical protein [Oscillospiraceae bacterium]